MSFVLDVERDNFYKPCKCKTTGKEVRLRADTNRMPAISLQPKRKLPKDTWHGRAFKTKGMIKNLFSKAFKADIRDNIKT